MSDMEDARKQLIKAESLYPIEDEELENEPEARQKVYAVVQQKFHRGEELLGAGSGVNTIESLLVDWSFEHEAAKTALRKAMDTAKPGYTYQYKILEFDLPNSELDDPARWITYVLNDGY